MRLAAVVIVVVVVVAKLALDSSPRLASTRLAVSWSRNEIDASPPNSQWAHAPASGMCKYLEYNGSYWPPSAGTWLPTEIGAV